MSALTVPGVDYAWQKPDPKTLKAQGYKFAMRYLSHDGSKNLTLAEKNALFAQGIGVGLVWESTAGRALKGTSAGYADAVEAQKQCLALGLPNAVVYFAVDFDVTDAQKPTVARYIEGAVKVLGEARVGVYGGYWVVRYLAEHETCGWFWQTYAWSGGRIHPKAHIYQWRNGVRLGDGNCDLNRAQASAGIVYPVTPKKASPLTRKRRLWRQHLAESVQRVKRLRQLLRRK